ncbi:uncharacterized protein K02A2.6-like, partial [Bombyx mandarina]|uniref:Uncharacterized protein K02A2.6-like n=1 Tax=Bombyx mandarina TaxID=7092 RepID=A0A6J2KP23_BOMMA
GGEYYTKLDLSNAFQQCLLDEESQPMTAITTHIVLSVDSSQYGLGAVLTQKHIDGTERLVSCASRTLAPAELNYSQLDKEALAIMFGVTKHVYAQCQACRSQRAAPPSVPLHSWPWPEEPWARLNLDFLGPFNNKYYLIIVDAHSKWIEVEKLS